MFSRPNSLKEKMAEILESHFENNQNPHETIHQMCELLGAEASTRDASRSHNQTKH